MNVIGGLVFAAFTGAIHYGAGYLLALGTEREDDGRVNSAFTGLGVIIIFMATVLSMEAGLWRAEFTWPSCFYFVSTLFGLVGGYSIAETKIGRAYPESVLPKRSTASKTVARPRVTRSVPKSKSSAGARSKGADWDNYYGKLVDLHGCGPGSAQRIISKVQAGQDLTDHENNFWQQVQ